MKPATKEGLEGFVLEGAVQLQLYVANGKTLTLSAKK